MGTPREPKPVKLVASLLSGGPMRIEAAYVELEGHFGPADYVSEALPFEHSSYYTPEFGPDLARVIVAFQRLLDPDELPAAKLATNAMEADLAAGGRRTVNIDPGYVSEGKLVLATTKDHQHRLYLGRGIYGEVTLRYFEGRFQPWPWTYPDYASPRYLEIFQDIRERYRAQLRMGSRPLRMTNERE